MKKNALKIKSLDRSGFALHGRKRFITLRAKPNWIPVSWWIKLYHLGLLNPLVKNVGAWSSNLIMLDTNKGLNLILKQLQGTTTYPLEIDNASIGTGTTPPTDTTINLTTPVVTGIVRAIGSLVGVNTLHTEWFITDDELPNGTYHEFGVFCGTQIFAMSIIDPSHTKGDREDTLIEYDFVAANS